MRYVVVSGGVISGVGKGIISSSIGVLLKSQGLNVTCIKIDPYLNTDAGLMNPKEHGEVFVLGSGSEVDLDLGNYERYLDVQLTGDHNITSGKAYLDLIQKERRGEFLGATLQTVPGLVNSIKNWIQNVAKINTSGGDTEPDVCIVELGGTIGDYESSIYAEALTNLRHEVGPQNFFHVFVVYILDVHGEHKSKPAQQANRAVRSYGLLPDLIACRAERPLADSFIKKVALHCQVESHQILNVYDIPSVYQVPLLLNEQGLVPLLRSKLNLDAINVSPKAIESGKELFKKWGATVTQKFDSEATIALVVKYTTNRDSYLSVEKSLEHSCMRLGKKLNLLWVDAEALEPKAKTENPEEYEKAWQTLKSVSGILVPGGFGTRGVEGKMLASKYARENKIPYLGVCLGFQVAVIQYARDVLSLSGANSEESDAVAKDKVVIFMPDVDKSKMGATMRLGRHKTYFQPGSEWSKLRTLYHGAEVIEERHRHRYEINPEYVDRLTESGLHFVGKDEVGNRMGIFELKDHPYFVGIQFHSEYQTRVLDPSKPYLGFVAASIGRLDEVLQQHREGAGSQLSVNGNESHRF